MKRYFIQVVAVIFLFILVGCNPNVGSIEKENKNVDESPTVVEKETNEIYASVGGRKISKEEMDYECFRVELQQALTNSATQSTCPREETIISQIIELKAIDYLAEVKGVSATADEVQQRMEKLKQDLSGSTIFQEKVKAFGEEKFWKYEQQRYSTIINNEKVKASLIEEEKQKHDYYDENSLKLTAQKNFDDLLVEAVGLVETTIFYH